MLRERHSYAILLQEGLAQQCEALDNCLEGVAVIYENDEIELNGY